MKGVDWLISLFCWLLTVGAYFVARWVFLAWRDSYRRISRLTGGVTPELEPDIPIPELDQRPANNLRRAGGFDTRTRQ